MLKFAPEDTPYQTILSLLKGLNYNQAKYALEQRGMFGATAISPLGCCEH
jgi:hypothetical protein